MNQQNVQSTVLRLLEEERVDQLQEYSLMAEDIELAMIEAKKGNLQGKVRQIVEEMLYFHEVMDIPGHKNRHSEFKEVLTMLDQIVS